MPRTVVIGAINWDVNLFINRFPGRGEEVVVREITRVPGGKAGNVAVAAARLLGLDKVAILGALGKDTIADEHVRVFRNEGILVDGLKFDESKESGQAYILIDENGENVIYTHPGANTTMTPQDLDTKVRKRMISEASIITIMDPPFETALRLAEQAKLSNKVVAWDPGVKSELGLTKTGQLVRNVDYVIANEFEMVHLTGAREPEAAAEKLCEFNSGLKFIVKLGAKGSIFFHQKDRLTTKPLDLLAFGLKTVNTVGCGDAFMGAFVAALSEGKSDLEALQWANCAGGLNSTRQETRGSPDRKTLLKYLN